MKKIGTVISHQKKWSEMWDLWSNFWLEFQRVNESQKKAVTNFSFVLQYKFRCLQNRALTHCASSHGLTESRSASTFHTEEQKDDRSGWLLLFPADLWGNRCYLHLDLVAERKREIEGEGVVEGKRDEKGGISCLHLSPVPRETAQ